MKLQLVFWRDGKFILRVFGSDLENSWPLGYEMERLWVSLYVRGTVTKGTKLPSITK